MATTKKAIAEAEQIVDKTTGELVEGVQIIEKPDTFTVDV